MTRPHCLVLGGPTAAGKSAEAMAVCEAWDAVLVSADAMQVYRGMDIGTAKPSAKEQERVRHEGIDLVEPDEPFDAAQFVALAMRTLDEHPRVVVAGGTSLYLRALIRGLVQTPTAPVGLRAELEALADPHGALMAVDPVLASRLHPNDRVRVIRGLEVHRLTGRPLSALQQEHALEPDRVVARGVWIDREDLRVRIGKRLGLMRQSGYVQEVEGLLDRGWGADLKPMQSLGYRHLCDHLVNDLPLDEAFRRTESDTWQFARKQRNWMRTLDFEPVHRGHRDAVFRAATSLWGS